MKKVDKPEQAVARMKEGFNCAQAILSTYASDFGVDPETALRVAGSFGSGMGRMGWTCGAVTGAFMVIALKHGKKSPTENNAQTRDEAYRLVGEFTARFNARYGSTACRDLIGYDLSTPEGWNAVMELGLFDTFCTQIVQAAAEILEELL